MISDLMLFEITILVLTQQLLIPMHQMLCLMKTSIHVVWHLPPTLLVLVNPIQLNIHKMNSRQVKKDVLFETQQLREMFPTCPENVLTAASERCATVDSAVDYVMNILCDQASMCSGVSTISLTSPLLIV